MQKTSGLLGVLSGSRAYRSFQHLLGGAYVRKWLVKRYLSHPSIRKIVDIGCGPSDIIGDISSHIEYVGIDISEEYIAEAKARHGDRGTFLLGSPKDFLQNPDERLNDADVVLCVGLLHHLEDSEVLELFELAKRVLTPTGALVCYEATYLVHQDRISKWIMRKDRGKNIRREDEWKTLVERSFSDYRTEIATGLIAFPYIIIIITCYPSADSMDQPVDASSAPRNPPASP